MKALVVAAAMLMGFAAPAVAQTTTLKYAFVNPMSSHFGAAATTFKEFVEKESAGKIKVDIFPGGALGGEREIVESMQLGTVDMAMTGTSIMGLMMLGAAMGDTITISAQGDGAGETVEALAALVEAKFGED